MRTSKLASLVSALKLLMEVHSGRRSTESGHNVSLQPREDALGSCPYSIRVLIGAGCMTLIVLASIQF